MKRYVLLFILIIFIQGCITPPRSIKSDILPADEVEAASHTKYGKAYVNSGRLDLAEIEFRKTLLIYPDLSSANNDLGYVLFAQGRLGEANTIFKKVLLMDPNNLVAQENLAQVLYQRGDYEEAAKEYEGLILKNSMQQLYVKNISFDSPDNQLSPKELSQIFRNLAIINYSLGITDEALCFSSLAWQTAATVEEAGRHARMLLALNKIDQALYLLKISVAFEPGSSSTKLLLDYGISLYAKQDFPFVIETLDKMLLINSIDDLDKRIAELIKLMIEAKQQPTLLTQIQQQASDLCDPELVDPNSYWPQVLADDISEFIGKNCITGDNQNA